MAAGGRLMTCLRPFDIESFAPFLPGYPWDTAPGNGSPNLAFLGQLSWGQCWALEILNSYGLVDYMGLPDRMSLVAAQSLLHPLPPPKES